MVKAIKDNNNSVLYMYIGGGAVDNCMSVDQTDSLLLAPNRRILYYWSRTEGFFTIGADQKDSLQGFFIIGAEQKDSLLLAPNRRILYCWRKAPILQQNLCNKPRGSGGGEICGSPRFEGHWLRVQRKASIPGFERHWSRFQRKAPICSKTCVINRVVQERGKFSDFHGSRATVSEGGKWPYV